jgi:nucleoside-diphosphate-sugar epimerase
VRAAGVSFGIVRPTLVVGPRDVLTSNIAWLLRRFPVFPLPGGGDYRLQPVTLGDTARIVADAVESEQDVEIDAAGPDTLSFRQYVELLARACSVRRLFVGAPRRLAFTALRLLEIGLKDVILTREELDGLEQELLVSHEAPLGQQSVVQWLMEHGSSLGATYVNDRLRHFGSERNEPILAP